MRWKVTGADASSGKDVAIEVEALTKSDAEERARYQGLFITDIQQTQPTLSYARPKSTPRNRLKDALSAFLDFDRGVRRGRILVAGFLVIAGGLILIGFIATRGDPTIPVAATSAASADPYHATLRFSDISSRLGDNFVIEQDVKTLRGTRRRVATDPGTHATLLILGEDDDLQYIHFAIPATIDLLRMLADDIPKSESQNTELFYEKYMVRLMPPAQQLNQFITALWLKTSIRESWIKKTVRDIERGATTQNESEPDQGWVCLVTYDPGTTLLIVSGRVASNASVSPLGTK
jgi:hypothetical protein